MEIFAILFIRGVVSDYSYSSFQFPFYNKQNSELKTAKKNHENDKKSIVQNSWNFLGEARVNIAFCLKFTAFKLLC